MSNWLHRILSEPVSAPAVPNGGGGGGGADGSWPQTPLTPRTAARMRDPNAPDYRYQVNQKCIYERRLPGGSYITAHVQRLQSGFYDSPVIHEDRIDNVRFVAINFVFHPSSSTFRFKSAEINIALHHTGEDKRNSLQVVVPGLAPAPPPPKKNSHDHGTQTETLPSNALVKSSDCLRVAPPPGFKPSRPKFLRHAPHLLYGGISPETLNWNFNLAGSLGVSQGPASASFKPSYGVKSSYKIYEMMKIQGSVRTLRSWSGREYDIEDGELVWTLEENKLQKSGLPREFTFVMLLTKGSGGFEQSGDVRLEIDVHPKVTGRLGAAYPSLITNLHQYQPFKRGVLDLDEEIGQVFEPQIKGNGFNFANIATSFDDFVWLPGTAYSTSDAGVAQSPTTSGAAQQQQQQQQQQAPQQQIMAQQGSQLHHRSGTQQQQQSQPHAAAGGSGDTTLNLRVFLEGPSRGTSGSPVPFPSHQQVMQQLVPYVNLKVPPPNPSRAQSPSVNTTSGGSRTSNSTTGPRRTITIGSSKSRSVRKRRSRTGLSGEYHTKESPTEEGKTTEEPQRSRGQGQVISLSAGGGSDSGGQRVSPAPARPFSYQEGEGGGDDLVHDRNAVAAAAAPSSASEWPEHNPNPTPKPQTKNASTTTPLFRPSSPEYATPPAYPRQHPQPRPNSMPGGLDDTLVVWDEDAHSPGTGRV
ncbi:uncharacterized protein Z520_05971 [Fonsecaea multimorphosa CBS 102226]|uniref:Uncharacterized protein n=1 Tax=Fonsecaea multimorphosa CBS 102226 TaxID=1442371 RepID=A0A0D2H9V7_9EURO|nr:uncharacterized protein Z520_05971 [Fonsecaea multimorphosa CBS 102226]KIX98670.1 hypothetical protein Z520_05971 [Fonsecaea multimorphosa CBS 102226]OAL24855.1 hypothetical protein AYO22_05644 [Fonsecaea multimorphosa]